MKEALREYYLFNLSGGRRKVKVLLSDILLVRAINGTHIDKLLYLKGDIIHTIRGHSLEELVGLTGFLIRVNKQDLVSPNIINIIEEDAIYLTGTRGKEVPKFVTLSRTYKKVFFDFFNYKKE